MSTPPGVDAKRPCHGAQRSFPHVEGAAFKLISKKLKVNLLHDRRRQKETDQL